MAREKRISMSKRELRKLEVARRIIAGELSQKRGAEVLDLSTRQVRRIVARVVEKEEAGVIHCLRGQPAHNRLDEKIQIKALKLYETEYAGFGPTLATEKLEERNKIRVSRETLRGWLIAAQIPYRQRRRKKHREWRERKACFGEMIQMDGSKHDWFEGRGPECVLMGMIDDATNTVFARFYEYEGTIPALDVFRRYSSEYGLPASLYLDFHSTYKNGGKASLMDEMSGEEALSQFERAVKSLSVVVLHAHSPQAKGRIERQFGTFQDRLIKEMRLEGICSIPEGNLFLDLYLPKYNRRFRRAAREAANLHIRKPSYQEMLRALTIQTERTVKNDSTIQLDGRLYLLQSRTWSKKVTVEDRLDGRRVIRDRNRELEYEEITARAKARIITTEKICPPRGARVREAHLTWG